MFPDVGEELAHDAAEVFDVQEVEDNILIEQDILVFPALCQHVGGQTRGVFVHPVDAKDAQVADMPMPKDSARNGVLALAVGVNGAGLEPCFFLHLVEWAALVVFRARAQHQHGAGGRGMGGKVLEHTQVGFGHLFRGIGRDAHAHRRTVHNEINAMGRKVGVHAPAIQQVELMAARREQGHGIAKRRHQMPADEAARTREQYPHRSSPATKAAMRPLRSWKPMRSSI